MAKETSTDVAVAGAQELEVAAKLAELEAQIAADNQADSDVSDFQIPLLKIGQGLTTEVTDGDARPGDFINALTREALGTEIQFVVAAFQKGRFDHGIRGERRARKAYNIKNVPWKDDPFFGRPFTEHPDAEETYAKRVNNGDMEWGKGPRISTTYDFYGYVLTADPDETPIPVCLSLMRKNKKPAQKWVTILNAVLRGRYWDCVFDLSTEQQRNDQGTFYTLNLKQARKTTAEERMEAVDLAQRVKNLNVNIVGADDDTEGKPVVEPDAAGGMEV